jgi:two-component system chemotaxis sensor kinase CheA
VTGVDAPSNGRSGDVDVLALFEQEAAERLNTLGDLLLELESRGPSDDLVGALFREAHTIKGAAAVVGLTELAEEAHALEDLLDHVRKGAIDVTPELVDDLLNGLDRLGALCGLEPHLELDEEDIVEPDDALEPEDGEVDDLPTAALARSETARVAVDRLDELVRLAGETTAAHLRLAQLFRDRLGTDPYAVPEMRAMSRLLTDLQERTLRARMLPLAAAATPLRRAVRDLARRTGKDVELELRGEDTELDRTVHERLADALLHLVRNAIDHGIELPEDRLRAGKPEKGTIIVHAMQLGSRVVVTVSDDGAGVDTETVRSRAQRFGIDTAGLDDLAVHQLLFHPGLTTATTVTDVSGRGVGLDAVREALSGLRGRVEVESTPGEGTRFRISVPITLTVLPGLVVEAGGQRYALPMSSIVTVVNAEAPLEIVEGRPTLRVGRTAVSVTPLADLLGVESTNAGPIVVVTGLSRTHAVRVDALHGQRDVLLKGLPALVRTGDLVVGASAEPDATVMLVLDAEAVIEVAARHLPNARSVPTSVPDRDRERERERVTVRSGRVLVVDDAMTVRELQRTILERAGYAVVTAIDGLDALANLDEAEPDLVLTDIEMPGMDGLDLTRAIRINPRWANVPIVILTSRNTEADRDAGMEAGADAYIVKSSFDEASLLGVVERLLGDIPVAVGQ